MTELRKGTRYLIMAAFVLFLAIPCWAHNPVLFVHGLDGSYTGWNTMKARLVADGWPDSILFAYTFPDSANFLDGANAANAKLIAGWVHQIVNQTGTAKVDLVSHSMGGLSTRYYVKFLGGRDTVGVYISLASPQHGTTLSIIGDMKPGSPLLDSLNQGDETPGGVLPDSGGTHDPGVVRWYSFYSNTDELVFPHTSPHLDGAINRLLNISHGAFLTDTTIYQWVRAALEGPSGVEETVGSRQEAVGRITARPNPFTSFARVPGHESERFNLYDVTGRMVGTYKGEKIGEGLAAGVYFLRPLEGGGKSIRIVKVR